MNSRSSFLEDLSAARNKRRRREIAGLEEVEEARDELEIYMSEQVMSLENERRNGGNELQLNFWKSNESRFPNLARMARRYLGIPASSTPIERVFSKTKSFLTTSRAGMLPQTAKESVLLYYWLRLDKSIEEDSSN